MVGDQLLCICSGDFVLKLGIGQTLCLRFHGQSSLLIAYPHAHFAAIGHRDQSVPDLRLTCSETSPAFVAHQELSFYLDGHVFLRAPENVWSGLATLRACLYPVLTTGQKGSRNSDPMLL